MLLVGPRCFRALLAVFLLLLPSFVGAEDFAAQMAQTERRHTLFGIPSGTGPHTRILIRDIYMMASNGKTKMADWVAYQLDASTVTGEGKTSRKWAADPWLSADETLEPADYDGANQALQVDRGHQAPLANFRGTPNWADTNYLSNITPQKSLLNQQAWRLLEEDEREYVVRHGGSIFVMTGPLYEREMPKLPKADEEHVVPSGYWRIIAVPAPTESPAPIRVAAFIFDQDTPGRKPAATDAVSVDDVERRAQLDFFWTLPDAIEEQLESGVDGGLVSELIGQ